VNYKVPQVVDEVYEFTRDSLPLWILVILALWESGQVEGMFELCGCGWILFMSFPVETFLRSSNNWGWYKSRIWPPFPISKQEFNDTVSEFEVGCQPGVRYFGSIIVNFVHGFTKFFLHFHSAPRFNLVSPPRFPNTIPLLHFYLNSWNTD
jgi:hypothetical protein